MALKNLLTTIPGRYGDLGLVTGPTLPTTNLILHLKGSAGITVDTGVSNWADQHTSGNDFGQGTGANQPTVQSAELNGEDVVRFDGSNDTLTSTSADFALNGSAGLTVVAVMRTNSDATDRGVITKDGDGDRGWALFDSNGVLGCIIATSASGRVRRNGAADSSGTWIIARFRYDGSVPEQLLWINGSADNGSIDGTPPATIGGNGGPANCILGDFTFSSANFWAGDIAELVVYNVALSDGDVTTVETIFNTTYAIF